jgi:hypothetical protein
MDAVSACCRWRLCRCDVLLRRRLVDVTNEAHRPPDEVKGGAAGATPLRTADVFDSESLLGYLMLVDDVAVPEVEVERRATDEQS